MKTVGMIGLGIMGSAMAASLVKAGYRVVGYDVLASRRRAHARAGGMAARSARDVGARAGIVICSLPSAAALTGTAAELRRHPGATRIMIETSTLPITAKEQARRTLEAARITLLDCPLSGTGAQARVKDLVVYASGSRAAYGRVARVLDGFARAHYHVGPFGAGSKTKFVANLLVAIHNVAAAEALVLAIEAGLDPRTTLNVLADGAGSSRMLQVRGPMMVRDDYSKPTMKLDVWQKDMRIIGHFVRQIGSPTPLFRATGPIYAAATALGPELDTGAVCAVLRKRARVRRRGIRRAR